MGRVDLALPSQTTNALTQIVSSEAHTSNTWSMSNINNQSSNSGNSTAVDADANTLCNHRRPTLVSSASSLDSILAMELPDSADLFDGMDSAFQNDDTIDDDDNIFPGENVMGSTSQLLMPASNSVSSSSLNDQQHQIQLQLPTVLASAADLQQQQGQFVHPHAAAPAPAVAMNNTVPEFLYQLTKMLTHDNKEIIEWSNGRIEVHSPHRLESEVLNKYFRHSKFASFQRQLNYFGFRKLAGKGKMAPCSYVNEMAGDEINSLLQIKRKGTVMNPRDSTLAKKKEASAKRPVENKSHTRPTRNTAKTAVAATRAKAPTVKPKPTLTTIAATMAPAAHSGQVTAHQALARRAVGRGVRHGYAAPVAEPEGLQPMGAQHTVIAASSLPGPGLDSLSQLANNYRNVLNEAAREASSSANAKVDNNDPTPLSEMQARNYESSSDFGGFLSRNSSLVDLAMIAPVDEDELEMPPPASSASTDPSRGFGFVDFPNPEVHPSNSDPSSNK